MTPYRYWLVAILVAFVLSACNSGSSSSGAANDDPDPPVEPIPEDPVDAEIRRHRYVQDLWLYDRISVVREDGLEEEITSDIVAEFSGMPAESVELIENVEFQVYPALAGYMTDAEDAIRTDVEVVAGVLSTPEGRALAVLATPHFDAEGPITFDDRISLDLTFLGERLRPGDPMLVDFAFVQSIPATESDEEVGLQGLALLRGRIDAGRINYFGHVVDGEPEVLIYTGEVGIAVAGSTRGSFPPKSRPMLDGFQAGVRACGRRGGLLCVAKYFNKFNQGAEGSLKLIDCNLAVGPTFCPPDPPPPPRPLCGIRCAKTSGDPHVSTFDGTRYSLQAVGEFVAARRNGLEVQFRTGPRGTSETLSVTTAVAIKVGEQRLVVDVHGDARVRVDGNAVSLDAFSGDGLEVGGARVTRGANDLRLETVSGDVVVVRRLNSNRFIDVWLEPADEDANWSGLFGDRDGDKSNDLRLRDGTVLAQPLSNETLYHVFADAWRISDAESLFDYPSGKGTADYTDLDFPREFVGTDTLDPAQRLRAESFCRAAGVVGQEAVEECVFDYGFTGDPGYVSSAAFTDIVEGILSGTRNADGTLSADYVRAQWLTSRLTQYAIGDIVVYDCPLRELSPTMTYCCSVAGTDVYWSGSSICFAAMHAGKLVFRDGLVGGTVVLEILPGLEGYVGSTANGVTTINWNSSPRSFVFR